MSKSERGQFNKNIKKKLARDFERACDEDNIPSNRQLENLIADWLASRKGVIKKAGTLPRRNSRGKNIGFLKGAPFIFELVG